MRICDEESELTIHCWQRRIWATTVSRDHLPLAAGAVAIVAHLSAYLRIHASVQKVPAREQRVRIAATELRSLRADHLPSALQGSHR